MNKDLLFISIIIIITLIIDNTGLLDCKKTQAILAITLLYYGK